MKPVNMIAKWQGRCRRCAQTIEVNSRFTWAGHKNSYHVTCWDGTGTEPSQPQHLPPPEADTYSPPEGLSTLKRQQLWAVAGVAFPNVNGTYFRKATNAMLRASLLTGILHPDIQAWVDHDLSFPTNGTAAAPTVTETVAAELDEGKVRELVAELLDEAIARRPNTHVTVTIPDLPRSDFDLAHVVFPKVLQAVALRLHVYLFGPAGTGKSTIAHQCAEALGLQFSFEALSPDKDASYLLGFVDAHGTYRGTEFHRVFTEGGVFLFDEIDNCDSSILAVLNGALANGCMVFPGVGMVTRHKDFVAIAAGNTWGSGADSTFIGRTALDPATLDRFVSIHVPIDESIEEACTLAQIADEQLGRTWISTVRGYRRAAEKHGIQIVVSPRASINGAKLLNSGWSIADTARATVFRGLGKDEVVRLGGDA